MGTYQRQKMAETRINTGLQPDRGVKVRPSLVPAKLEFVPRRWVDRVTIGLAAMRPHPARSDRSRLGRRVGTQELEWLLSGSKKN
jgi:hypothetical protein